MRVALPYIGITVLGLVGAYALATAVASGVTSAMNRMADTITAASHPH